MPEIKNEIANQEAFIERALHDYTKTEYVGWADQMPPHEVEKLLRGRPDLVMAFADIVKMHPDNVYRPNQIIFTDFLDFLKKAPDYLEALLPVFKIAPALFPIYAAYAEGLHALPPEKRTSDRFYDTRIVKTSDAALVLPHLQEIQSLVQKIKATAPENDDLSAVTTIFDGAIDVHVRRTNAHNLLGITIWIGASKENHSLQKKLAPFSIGVTGAGLVDTRTHARDNKEFGYLYKPESTQVDEKALLTALAQFAPNSPELRQALEANTVLEDWLTR